MKIPQNAKLIIHRLQNAGFEAFAVGGCVRDSLLGFTPHDWDICTSAKPEQIKACFEDFNTIDIGIKHGTVAIIVDKEPFEVTTYRVDGEYRDNRHPESVTFTSNLREDLARRDFTVNAIAYNDEYGIADFYGGESDLRNRLFAVSAIPMSGSVRTLCVFSARCGLLRATAFLLRTKLQPRFTAILSF